MNRLIVTCFLFLASSASYAQEKLVKDLDFDGIQDNVYFDTEKKVIIAKLSSTKFKVISSKPINIEYSSDYGIRNNRNGFEFFIIYSRYGSVSRFKFEKKTNIIRLIGMRHRESGLTEYDANGEASVNLLLGNYIGNWAYNDVKKENYLIEIPTIKTKMPFKKIYLTDFSERIYDSFLSKSSALFVKHKEIAISKQN
jgi:hypothetical protein